ncbi:undecaprenyl/decaprenyl-phosphate alpha-N-acetylglucosaminyl 1-phosphate transferase [Demequina sp. TTPB684]|uniref:MraY family glycosyltransferase n=1 Tax=unclassified Demequina TaxID=2620311 RepID=UPI001CF4102E|nr:MULTISPECIES: MraY family glycosyltransferase [unclassified Demequina]MCB2411773.1 undecaprenyl/decaprenyl-phosphate alpha-N-acetylglucosaminyl 1-phosphate transferase [Demequina sp. TTPB684]UPU88637.1 undecaprenyl/decaprenyl-phosphate alpha-N-acetylglucosaminyl 1-phosphate transferase [Demequina sp. TMPB413]
MKVYLTLLVVSALVTYVATPAMRHLAIRLGAVTAVRARDVHLVPTARLGGVAIYLGLAAGLLLASTIPFLSGVFAASNSAWAVMAGAGLVCAVGVVDDVWDLDWMAKLAGQILAALLMAWGGVQLVALPIGGRTIGDSYLSLIATVVIVVVAINAVNFVDGLDGLAAGLVAIGGMAFMVYTYALARDASPGDYSSLATVLAAVMVGACLGFLPHNVHPARIFMGDSGSMVLGLAFAAAAITVTGQIDPQVVSQRATIPAFLPMLLPLAVVAIPLLDMGLAFLRRLGKGKSPFQPDAHHLHHRLLKFGHSHRWAVAVLWLWTFVVSFSAASVVLVRLRYAALMAVLGLIVAAGITFSPGLRRCFGRLWRGMGVAAGPARRLTPEGRETLQGSPGSHDSPDSP